MAGMDKLHPIHHPTSLPAAHPTIPLAPQAEIEARPLLFGSFMARDTNENPVYTPTPGYDPLKKALEEKLAEYNDNNAVMDLVRLGLGVWAQIGVWWPGSRWRSGSGDRCC